eukprot:GHVR01026787.1.p2 GENE.GHVR01026787.1~~GHVR01026787.1.p2  ORF type:complete len:222 (+),score=8.73 GHVR01026787.1:388-1053(+)
MSQTHTNVLNTLINLASTVIATDQATTLRSIQDILEIDVQAPNGPLDFGLSAGIDSNDDPEFHVPLIREFERTQTRQAVFAAMGLKFRGVSEPEVEWAFRGAVFYIIKRKWYDEGKCVKTIALNDCVKEGIKVSVQSETPFLKYIVAHEVNITKAMTIIFGTKVNFYHCNHHVGVGSLQGYVRKLIELSWPELLKDTTQESIIRNIVWICGHYCLPNVLSN